MSYSFFFLATLRNIAIQTKCSCRCSCPLPNEINFTAIIVPQPTPPPKHSAWLVIVLLASKLSYTHQWRMLTTCIYISERRDKFLNEINLTVIIVTLHPPQNQNTAHDWLSYTSRPSYRTRANGDGN